MCTACEGSYLNTEWIPQTLTVINCRTEWGVKSGKLLIRLSCDPNLQSKSRYRAIPKMPLTFNSRCWAAGFLALLLILVFSMFSFDAYPTTFRRHWRRLELAPRRFPDYDSPSSSHFVSYESILMDNFSFNINGSDVIVFLHIQKTGEYLNFLPLLGANYLLPRFGQHELKRIFLITFLNKFLRFECLLRHIRFQ